MRSSYAVSDLNFVIDIFSINFNVEWTYVQILLIYLGIYCLFNITYV